MGLQKFFKQESFMDCNWVAGKKLTPSLYTPIISLILSLVVTSCTIIVYYSQGSPYRIAHWGSPSTGRQVSVLSTTLWLPYKALHIYNYRYSTHYTFTLSSKHWNLIIILMLGCSSWRSAINYLSIQLVLGTCAQSPHLTAEHWKDTK